MPAADLEAIRAEELDLIDAAIRSLLRLTRNERRPGYVIDAWGRYAAGRNAGRGCSAWTPRCGTGLT
jgi:hypothetical protein